MIICIFKFYQTKISDYEEWETIFRKKVYLCINMYLFMLPYGLVQWLAIEIFTITLLVISSSIRAMSSPFHLYVKTALTFPAINNVKVKVQPHTPPVLYNTMVNKIFWDDCTYILIDIKSLKKEDLLGVNGFCVWYNVLL